MISTIEVKTLGRPRDAQCSTRISRAAIELLAEHGYDRLSMESVAERAQTSKATLYRRWSSKAELVAAAISDVEGHAISGSLQGRERLIEQLAAFFGVDDPTRQKVLVGLSSALCRHPELAVAVQATFDSKQCQDAARSLGAGLASHELVADIAPALLFYRLIFRGEAITRDRIESVVDGLVLPFLSCETATSELKGNHAHV
ncbi:TetR/AcrR family transcriptional regulator [soil metagenome]